MKFWVSLVIGLLWFIPVVAYAQDSFFGPSVMEQQVVLAVDGSVSINGEKATQHTIEALTDKYVFRYKALDQPEKIIDTLTVRLTLPSTVTVAEVRPNVIAVHGVGSTTITPVSSNTFDFQANAIGPEAVITITAEMPLSALKLSTGRQVVADLTLISSTQLLLLSSVIPLLILLYTAILFVSRSRDVFLRPIIGNPIMPTRLPPAYVGALLTGNVSSREIAATIIDLARRGYIDIIYQRDGEYGFSKKKDWQYDKGLLEFERSFLNQLTSNTFINSSQKINQSLNSHVWNEAVSQGIELIYADMTRLGYFSTNPKRSHLAIRTVGIVLFFLSAIGFGLTLLYFTSQPMVAIPWLVSMAVSPLIIRSALLVPKRTAVGRQQAALWLGFKQYLTTDEYFRYPEDVPLFDTYLAFAVAFGVEGKWTARFTHLPCQLPEWFFSEATLIDGYTQLGESLFGVMSTISQRFSLSRKPTSV